MMTALPVSVSKVSGAMNSEAFLVMITSTPAPSFFEAACKRGGLVRGDPAGDAQQDVFARNIILYRLWSGDT